MTSQAYFIQPPRMATWLVNLFTPAEEGESILGDLLEEFSYLASKSGVAFARRWYWRQAVKTIAHLAGTGFRVAPWSTTAVVVGGFLLLRFVSGLPERAIFAVLERYQVFDHHFDAYVFFATYGIATGHVIASMFVGCVVALAAKGREMVVTMMLSLVLGALFGVAIWRRWPGDDLYLWGRCHGNSLIGSRSWLAERSSERVDQARQLGLPLRNLHAITSGLSLGLTALPSNVSVWEFPGKINH